MPASFTEFYCDFTNGSNLNGGGTTSASAAYTCTNSNWDGTSVFTPTDGSTPASFVNVGDYASVFLDAATVGVYIARVTAVAAGVNGAITLSTTAKGGTAPTSSATGRSIRVGGAWKGPNSTEPFPFNNIINSAATNTNGDTPRVNMRNNASYTGNGLTFNSVGPVFMQGYSSTPGDGGRATIDFGTSVNVLQSTGNRLSYLDMIFVSSASSGTGTISVTGADCLLVRVTSSGMRSTGITAGGTNLTLIECEAYGNNTSNAAGGAGISLIAQGTIAIRCYSHDNTGSNTSGYITSSGSNGFIAVNCIADTNGLYGFFLQSRVSMCLYGCDAYNNVNDGIRIDAQTSFFPVISIQNTNSISNGTGGTGYGINLQEATDAIYISNVGFFGNTSGETNGFSSGGYYFTNSITYTASPYIDAPNGNFGLLPGQAWNAGVGNFTETGLAAQTTGFPDIGSAQHRDAGPPLVKFLRVI